MIQLYPCTLVLLRTRSCFRMRRIRSWWITNWWRISINIDVIRFIGSISSPNYGYFGYIFSCFLQDWLKVKKIIYFLFNVLIESVKCYPRFAGNLAWFREFYKVHANGNNHYEAKFGWEHISLIYKITCNMYYWLHY